ncbi:MAG: hypothetical protein AAGA56_13970, partial [Myxococcota bacterium]
TVRFTPVAQIRKKYRAAMLRIVEYLESQGVVVVLHSVVRHMEDGDRLDCDRGPGDLSDWRIAVQTSALSRVAAEIACERKLPFLDIRRGFDTLRNHGIGLDGVHPNAHRGGADRLDRAGLQCGYNVRNYLSLRQLRVLFEALEG